ncbi:MAG: TIR protein [Anaerolinea thermophila]|uniref:TIR protein n=1 Tax=Anaerolinea thermophila TaxID=167964 RepID=A0A117LGZ1_9CHLR|nr:MAG: TIR protein [Anaerolinea thermophila]
MEIGSYPYRIFIAYSHEDRNLLENAVRVLEENGYHPLCDKNIMVGKPFTDEIKRMIAHAHIFLPLLTENSSLRPWVHQETGYALAMNIPVLPVAVGTAPGEMTAQLHAVAVCDDFSDFPQKVSLQDIENLVMHNPSEEITNLWVTAWAEERTKLLGEYAFWVSNLHYYGRVRQRAALSSFSIPDVDVQEEIWKLRDGNVEHGRYYHSLQRAERQNLQAHAEKSGCDLLIDPDFCLERHGMNATRVRLEILLEFLKDKSKISDVRVVISEKAHQANLTIVGDWFSAESFSPKVGESHSRTIFCRHAPTVLSQMRSFDDQFNKLLLQQGTPSDTSRDWAIGYISEILRKRT